MRRRLCGGGGEKGVGHTTYLHVLRMDIQPNNIYGSSTLKQNNMHMIRNLIVINLNPSRLLEVMDYCFQMFRKPRGFAISCTASFTSLNTRSTTLAPTHTYDCIIHTKYIHKDTWNCNTVPQNNLIMNVQLVIFYQWETHINKSGMFENVTQGDDPSTCIANKPSEMISEPSVQYICKSKRCAPESE